MIWNELKELQKLFDDYIFSEPLKLLLTYDEIRYNHYIKPLQTIHIQYKIIHMNMELLSILKTAFGIAAGGPINEKWQSIDFFSTKPHAYRLSVKIRKHHKQLHCLTFTHWICDLSIQVGLDDLIALYFVFVC